MHPPSRTTAQLALAACLSLVAVTLSRPAAQTAAPPPAVAGFEQLHKIDIHAHIYEDIPAVAAMLQRANVRVINISNPGTDGHLAFMHDFNATLVKAHPDVFSFASTFDLTTRDQPRYGPRMEAALDETFAQGAVMVKIWKEVGLELLKPDGTYLLPDDASLDPIYRHLAERKIPLLAHLAEPREAWLPLDSGGLHSGYYKNNPQWHLYRKSGVPTHQQLMEARDHVLLKHPNLIVIGAHIGSMEHDVAEAAKRLDRYPNFNVEVSARTRDLTRQPTEKVRAFLLKYQDRILYGTDRSWRPYRTPNETPTDAQREAFAKGLENQYRLDYAYYAGSKPLTYNGQTVQPLALPREVLEKFYFRNAQRLIGVK
ncbi:MAG TPA: amidohydrolase family protein [Luteitalea sp.]|nr:amidohydrolase family protein [Luteitalea sp.]